MFTFLQSSFCWILTNCKGSTGTFFSSTEAGEIPWVVIQPMGGCTPPLLCLDPVRLLVDELSESSDSSELALVGVALLELARYDSFQLAPLLRSEALLCDTVNIVFGALCGYCSLGTQACGGERETAKERTIIIDNTSFARQNQQADWLTGFTMFVWHEGNRRRQSERTTQTWLMLPRERQTETGVIFRLWLCP